MKFLHALILAGLALGMGRAEAGPIPTAPAAFTFRLGALDLVALSDAKYVVPNDGKTFGVGLPPATVAAVLTAAGAPADRITLSVNALLVKAPGRVILIDTGLGPRLHGALPQSLARAGVAPGAVTDVLITHTHGDHVGGLVTAAGALAFPNAAIRMSSREWAFMRTQGYLAAVVTAVALRVQTFDPGAAVAPGVTAVSLPGHTPGHVGYEIDSGGQRLLDVGDIAHSSILSLARPAWTIEFDQDAGAGKATRIATLARLAQSHELIFSPHFPFPGIGRIKAAGGGYAWEAEKQ